MGLLTQNEASSYSQITKISMIPFSSFVTYFENEDAILRVNTLSRYRFISSDIKINVQTYLPSPGTSW